MSRRLLLMRSMRRRKVDDNLYSMVSDSDNRKVPPCHGNGYATTPDGSMSRKRSSRALPGHRSSGPSHKHRGKRRVPAIDPSLVAIGVCIVVSSLLIFNYSSTIIFYVRALFLSFGKGGHTDEILQWQPANTTYQMKFGTDICTVDRRNAIDFTEVEFERDFRHKKPLILTFPNGAADWTDSSLWTMDTLKTVHGDSVVFSGNAREIVRRGGSGYVPSTLREYIRTMELNNTAEPLYVFDRNLYASSFSPSSLKPPVYLKIQDDVDDSMFFLGSSGSGVSFHKHADGWNGVVFGRKRWFLYPVERTPPGGVFPGYSQQEWFDQIYPVLSDADKPLECVQNAGEIMYLPESIYHATINIGDTVAVGIQKEEASTPVEKLFYEDQQIIGMLRTEKKDDVRQQLHRQREKIIEKLLTKLPDNTEVLLKAGHFYRESQLLEKALTHTQAAVQKDPHFILAVLNLADIQSQLGRQEDADIQYRRALTMNPNLWDVYAQYGDYLLNHARPNEAVKLYKQGAELQPEMMAFWKRLHTAQDRAGDVDGAKETQTVINKMKLGRH